MSTSIADPTPESAASLVARVASVLAELRELAATSPALARRLGWDYLRELGAGNRRDQLAELFAKGVAPDGPHGEMEGLIVGKLFGIPEAHLANPLMKIDPTWRGKTFDQRSGTGFNRLSPLGKYTLRAVAPLYGGLRRAGREVQGYGFTHQLDTAAAEPFNEVRALDYSPAEYRNPSVRTFPIKRTRDEIVELVPRLYLGRALLTMPDGEVRLIAYFALREFSDERDA
ncbi:uncharacterized protein PO1_contig-009-132 [Mycobacterium sp. PO1]|uniref:Uncharacterized protein n=1 Tax=Mycolicibacterium parafortuitum TaxID=39692 RepID=A0ACC6MA34_MYCPF|nr:MULTISPECIES: hypothetical protein [Mycobacteriaceae]MDZ5083793.1 hypothetical protein [Mycolicibacterium parafortuitum]GFM16731.1 uncharacterized protein PO1_contig-009-132 [Mycobacterium sp. PO1]GFM21586.1 uncharacterized protein PO2_contig-001-34 [Mycobacterium sp. PO2]